MALVLGCVGTADGLSIGGFGRDFSNGIFNDTLELDARLCGGDRRVLLAVLVRASPFHDEGPRHGGSFVIDTSPWRMDTRPEMDHPSVVPIEDGSSAAVRSVALGQEGSAPTTDILKKTWIDVEIKSVAIDKTPG